MAGNWQQELVMDEERERGQRAALTQPFGMLVTSINSDTEEAKFSYFGARDRQITISHPFASSGSWIRAMPEEGSTYIGQFRADEANPQPVGTVTRGSLKRNEAYKKNQGIYRPLFPGEIEINSRGAGQMYFSRRPKTEMHGGILNRWADQDKLLVADRSPIHNKQFLQYKHNELGDEERIGIISRPKKLKASTAVANAAAGTGSGNFSTWEIAYPKVRENFAAEHYVSMKNPANESPAVLFNYQRGHVLDNEGTQILQNKTQIPLRYRSEYFANDDTSTVHEIDEKGNTFIQLATAAVEGYELDVPAGNYVKTVELDETITIIGNRNDAVGKSVAIDVGGGGEEGGNYKLAVENDIDIQSRRGNGFMKFSSAEGANQFALQMGNLFFILDATDDKNQIFILHSSGTQLTIDDKGSLKTATTSGNSIFMDAEQDSLTMTSADGSVVSLRDNLTLSDSSGANLISMNGTDTIQISAKAKVNLNAQSVTIGGGSINFGTIAPLSVALAEPLAVLFDTHIHATPMGPSSPPLPPNTAALINASPATSFKSEFVKVRTNLA